MLIAYWIVAGLSAVLFFAAGLLKVVRPLPALAASGMGWVDDYTPTSVRLIGLAEVVGALGLVLPVLTGIAPILSPVAALALAVIMVGAIVTHVRRSEPPVAAVLLALALASAVLGFLVVL
ncbi:DoxX family protein [Leifsonia aquatica]|uniref:DoxX family protein n=1 Tax=Leifsonia aquatica TaxID=144185 RepID=UPI00046867C1|nr:DoxX family protein [Leifsonia aquatica]